MLVGPYQSAYCCKVKYLKKMEGRETAIMPVSRKESSVDTKDLVLDIAKGRFARFGYKKTSMDEICKDAQISKKTLYEVFKTKEDLFVALFIKEALTARKFVMDRLRKVQDPREKIGRFMQVSREYFEKHPFMVQVLRDQDGLYAPYLKQEYMVFVEDGIRKIFSDIVKAGIEKGEFKEVDTDIAAYIIFKLFQAFTYAKTMNYKSNREKEKREMAELVEFISKGLSH
jgi:AcrR family transcriptional regulator